jgi:shikimate dehydrogenase
MQRVRVGLIGRNIGASRSPWMHEQEGEAQGLDLSYELFDFAESGQDESNLESRLAQLQQRGYAGVNITYPYKQAVITHLDHVSDGARRVGAVNTVQFCPAGRIGYNTDVTGFSLSLQQGLPGASMGQVLQMGAGGAGAATAQALLDLGVGKLLICDFDAGRAAALVERLGAQHSSLRVAVCNDVTEALRGADGLVNATPVGMHSHPGSPVDVDLLDPRLWVADIVYFPLETALLAAARARGCRTLDGSGMAVHQAAAAFEIFTGRRVDVERMRRSFVDFSLARHPGRAEAPA